MIERCNVCRVLMRVRESNDDVFARRKEVCEGDGSL